MKVRITKPSHNSWYNDLIGCVFEVKELKKYHSYFLVVNKGFKGDTYFIEKSDCEIIPDPYTYAEVDISEWWDGRPIKGYFWDGIGDEKVVAFLCGIAYNKTCKYFSSKGIFANHFEPITTTKSVKLVIEEDGETRETELTAEQMERLGL